MNRNQYTIKEMTRLLGVSLSAYYQWARKGVAQQRKTDNTKLIRLVREIVLKHHYRYGSPRVRLELRNVYEKRVSLKKVARLMRENNLNAQMRKKFIRTTDSKHSFTVCENILNREFHA
jgi:transposase InsO family protein